MTFEKSFCRRTKTLRSRKQSNWVGNTKQSLLHRRLCSLCLLPEQQKLTTSNRRLNVVTAENRTLLNGARRTTKSVMAAVTLGISKICVATASRKTRISNTNVRDPNQDAVGIDENPSSKPKHTKSTFPTTNQVLRLKLRYSTQSILLTSSCIPS